MCGEISLVAGFACTLLTCLPYPNLPCLMRCAVQVRSQLASRALPVRLLAGFDLYCEGDRADSFFVLQEGGESWTGGVAHCRALGQVYVQFPHCLLDFSLHLKGRVRGKMLPCCSRNVMASSC
jgi:hypothetical protein